MTELRRRLRAAGVEYVVVKNTLAQRALAGQRDRRSTAHLQGPTGLVLAGKDPLAAAKVLTDFAKENEKPTVKAGWWTGRPSTPASREAAGRAAVAAEVLARWRSSPGALERLAVS